MKKSGFKGVQTAFKISKQATYITTKSFGVYISDFLKLFLTGLIINVGGLILLNNKIDFLLNHEILQQKAIGIVLLIAFLAGFPLLYAITSHKIAVNSTLYFLHIKLQNHFIEFVTNKFILKHVINLLNEKNVEASWEEVSKEKILPKTQKKGIIHKATNRILQLVNIQSLLYRFKMDESMLHLQEEEIQSIIVSELNLQLQNITLFSRPNYLLFYLTLALNILLIATMMIF